MWRWHVDHIKDGAPATVAPPPTDLEPDMSDSLDAPVPGHSTVTTSECHSSGHETAPGHVVETNSSPRIQPQIDRSPYPTRHRRPPDWYGH